MIGGLLPPQPPSLLIICHFPINTSPSLISPTAPANSSATAISINFNHDNYNAVNERWFRQQRKRDDKRGLQLTFSVLESFICHKANPQIFISFYFSSIVCFYRQFEDLYAEIKEECTPSFKPVSYYASAAQKLSHEWIHVPYFPPFHR